MKRLIQLAVCSVLLTSMVACVHELDNIKPSIQSTPTDLPPGMCSMVTINNHIRTNRRQKPSKQRYRMDIYRMGVIYKIYATSEADPAYQSFVLGDDNTLYEDTRLVDTCAERDSDTNKCIRWTTERKEFSILDYGALKTIELRYENMLDQTKKVPSHFTFNLDRIEVRGSGEKFDNLSYAHLGFLDCFSTHLVTLYNAQHTPADSSARVAVETTTAAKVAMKTSSFSLLTQSERDQLKKANGHQPTITRMSELYARRNSELKQYLVNETHGKGVAALIAIALENGNWREAGSLVRKSATGSTQYTAKEVLAVLPGTTDVIGAELAQGFAQAIAEKISAQAELDAQEISSEK